jgi:hypothetical protein
MACDCIGKKESAIKNPEQHKAYAKDQYNKHREATLANKQVYRQANKGKINALVAARKQYIKQRTPSWVGKEEMWIINEIYELASLRTKITLSQWHVDHILPLQGRLVSGLHTPENMQVIPAIINITKKNKFEVEYA